MKSSIQSIIKGSSRRKSTIADMVQSLIISRKVSSTNCATHFPGSADASSKIRRVERFYSNNYLETKTAIDFLSHFRSSGKCLLIMDRTNWQSLMNVELLDNNGGSSSFEDRKLLIEPVIKQLGKERVEAQLCDREFFSFKFISYLLEKNIPFVIRIKENLQFIQPLLSAKTFREQLIGTFDNKAIYVDLSGKKLKDEYLLLVSFKVANPLELYRKRWEVECFFKRIKTAGFHIESTHIKIINALNHLSYYVPWHI